MTSPVAQVVGRELAALLGLAVAAAAGGEHDGAGVDECPRNAPASRRLTSGARAAAPS